MHIAAVAAANSNYLVPVTGNRTTLVNNRNQVFLLKQERQTGWYGEILQSGIGPRFLDWSVQFL